MSDDLYYKYGVLLEDDFFLFTSTATSGVTGQAANFTLKLAKNGTGNQSTTGITLTEVSSTNNPGLYHLSCSATTSFVAATGEYSLTISWDTDPNYKWEKTYRLTSNGLPTGTTGTANFTSTANDGRVTDGTNPLENATLFFRTPSGIPYATVTTDSSGLAGPVFFTGNGTWPFYAQLAGYSVGEGSVVVSGATATGPGADIALSAIGAASGLTLSSLMTYARYQARGVVGNSADAQLKSAINDALQELARRRKWSWLKTDGQISTNAVYATGTVTLTNNDATVTLASGTWPSWAASGVLLYGGIYYRVAARTSGTDIELETAYIGTTVSGVGYTLYQDEYTLPTDCLIFDKVFPCMGWGEKPDMVSFESIREYQATNNYNGPKPNLCAIHNDKIIFWPAPTTSRVYPLIYYRRPATLVNAVDEADWDPNQLSVLQRAIDVQIAYRWGTCQHGDAKTCEDSFDRSCNLAVNNDRENASRSGAGRGSRRSIIGDLTLPDAT